MQWSKTGDTQGDYSPFCWYYIKPTVFRDTTDGQPGRIRATRDETPDAWTLFVLPQQVSWSARATRVVGDYPTSDAAYQAMVQTINRDKAIHLLGGQPPEPEL